MTHITSDAYSQNHQSGYLNDQYMEDDTTDTYNADPLTRFNTKSNASLIIKSFPYDCQHLITNVNILLPIMTNIYTAQLNQLDHLQTQNLLSELPNSRLESIVLEKNIKLTIENSKFGKRSRREIGVESIASRIKSSLEHNTTQLSLLNRIALRSICQFISHAIVAKLIVPPPNMNISFNDKLMNDEDISPEADWKKVQYLRLVWSLPINNNNKICDYYLDNTLGKYYTAKNEPDIKELADIGLILIEYIMPKTKSIIKEQINQLNE